MIMFGVTWQEFNDWAERNDFETRASGGSRVITDLWSVIEEQQESIKEQQREIEMIRAFLSI